MKTTKVRPQLYAYLGLDEEGDLALYCSTGRLNPIGSRLERGTPLPRTVHNFMSGESGGGTDVIIALEDLQDHFDNEASGKR